MAKAYTKLNEMLNDLPGGKEYKEKARDYIRSFSISTFLTSIRCDAGLTQKELSKKIGCNQSRISKIENSINEKISFKDLEDYSIAFNMQLMIGFETNKVTIADQIKHHVLKTKELLSKIADLSKGDKTMTEGLTALCSNITVKFADSILDALEKVKPTDFPKLPEEKLHISKPLDTDKLKEIVKPDLASA